MDFSYLVFLALKSAISLSVSLTIPPNVVRNKDLEFCSCFQVFGNSTKLNEDMNMCSKDISKIASYTIANFQPLWQLVSSDTSTVPKFFYW